MNLTNLTLTEVCLNFVLRMNNKLKRRFYKVFGSIVLLVALRTFRTYLIQVTHNNCNSPKTIDFVWYLVLTNLCSLPLLTWVKMISKGTILFLYNCLQNPGYCFGATSYTALPISPIWPIFAVNGLDWHR